MKAESILACPVIWALHLMTARAMEVPFRPGLPALRTYAAFTRDRLNCLSDEQIPGLQERMYRISRRMGAFLRALLCIRSEAAARRVLFRLYRCIGIELAGSCPGSVTVKSCCFSEFYTPRMCRVMSAMDRGIFAGLFGGGELTFEARITEGCACCRAVFARERNEV